MVSPYPIPKLSDLPGAVNPGIEEASVRSNSGLRVETYHFRTVSDINYLSALGTLLPGATLALTDRSTWANIGVGLGTDFPVLSNRVLPYPVTPCIKINQVNGGGVTYGATVRFRMTGYDQFGNPQIETTPWLTLRNSSETTANEANFYFYMSKVFSIVTSIEYMAEGLVVGDVNKIQVGMLFYPDPQKLPPGTGATFLETGPTAGSGSNNHGGFWNQGFGLPIRCRSFVCDELGVDGSGVVNERLQDKFGVGLVNGKGQYDCLGGLVRRTSGGGSEQGPFGVPVVDTISGFNKGGFLIGQSDVALPWQGDQNKIMVIWGDTDTTAPSTSPLIFDMPIVGVPVYVPTDANGAYEYDISFFLHTTLGKAGQPSDYPVLNRP